MSEFSNTWFERQAQPVWEEHLLGRWQEPINYLEIGVCEGRSMLWIFENLPVAKAVGIDPWLPRRRSQKQQMREQKERAYRNLELYADRLELIEEVSQTALASIHEQFDLIYVDGDHRAPEALLDMGLAFRLLRTPATKGGKGGMMVVDDLNRTWVMGRPQVYISTYLFELAYHGRVAREWRSNRQAAYVRIDN